MKIPNKTQLTFTETLGEINFYQDQKTGKCFQQITDTGDIFPVKNGTMSYKPIKIENGYNIKYNTNGVRGYAVFKGKVCLEDNIWELQSAINFCSNN